MARVQRPRCALHVDPTERKGFRSGTRPQIATTSAERESLAKYRGSVGDRSNPPTDCFSLATVELQDRIGTRGARSRVGRDGGEGGVRPEVRFSTTARWPSSAESVHANQWNASFNSTSLLHRLGLRPRVKADVLIGGVTES